MRSVLRRALVALLFAPSLALGPALPPEHVHELHEEHGHSPAHRHVAFHGQAGSHAQPIDHDGLEVGAGDEQVVWISGVGLSQGAFSLTQDWAPAGDAALALTASTFAIRRLNIDASPPHGPPRASSSLRGPPVASA